MVLMPVPVLVQSGVCMWTWTCLATSMCMSYFVYDHGWFGNGDKREETVGIGNY